MGLYTKVSFYFKPKNTICCWEPIPVLNVTVVVELFWVRLRRLAHWL